MFEIAQSGGECRINRLLVNYLTDNSIQMITINLNFKKHHER